MSDWKNCVVALVDMIGVTRLANQNGAGSIAMCQLHAVVAREMEAGLPSIAHAYTWNDSVLLLAYLEGQAGEAETVLRDVEVLKRRIDAVAVARSYAIAIQGQCFPSPATLPQACVVSQNRVTILDASSWAMANCFEIEKVLGKTMRKPWYVDGRIAKRLSTNQTYTTHRVKLLPSGRKRDVYVYEDYLW